MPKNFADRLRDVIGDGGKDYTPWAQLRGISPATVEGWLNKGLKPYAKSLAKLEAGTGIPSDWWLNGGDSPAPAPDEARRPTYSAAPSAGRVEQVVSDYVAIPLYNGVRAAAGAGSVIESEVADDALMFKESWVRLELGARPQDLYLIRVGGDSMEPTLRSGDVILVDRRTTRPDREGIYILRMNGMLLVKRLQALPGSVVKVTSDNAAFSPFEVMLADLDGPEMAIIGRVVWTGRRL